jgi:hypothetical protein
MAGGAAAPTVYGGGFVEYSLNGTDISPYVSEAELTEEDDVLEFKGSGGSATARIPNGVTNGFSLTVASNGTTAPLLRTLHRTVPKPTHGYDSGDVITIDVEFTVVGDIG